MADQIVETRSEPRSGLSLLLRRTPFTHVLRGCTVAEVLEADPAEPVPRGFGLRRRGDALLLRYYGGSGFTNTTWSVKAEPEQTRDGVLLRGHVRYLLDRCYFAVLALSLATFLGIAVGLVLTRGSVTEGAVACLLGAGAFAFTTAVLIWTFPRTTTRRAERARRILGAAYPAVRPR